ncbi:uncharacterized protein LOC111369124 [Olea europaea var. sylvestris]|uniref:uncharacterized protein LOC111369124 n=1 Tax=Olea europaea var. sylvestris TaxID=158386 RepID=UPI000C1CF813|nr:uncharacterized protein LOC111369124 [Olea europaea var. sylvestris]
MAGAKVVHTPMSITAKLLLNDGTAGFAVNPLAQFMLKPTVAHWQHVKRLLRYIKQTIHFEILLHRQVNPILRGFSDAGGLRKPPLLLYDNVGVTQLSLNPVMHSRMKLIAIDLHFVCDYVRRGQLRVSHIHTDDQLADLLTKPLARSRFHLLCSKINVSDGSLILRGRIRNQLD